MSRKEKEFSLRKELIINAAEQLFIDVGFEKTTMDDIAKKAEYTKPTLYKYFKNREEILLGLYIRGWDRSVKIILNAIESEEKGFDKLVAAAKVNCDFFVENSVYFMLLNYAHSNAIKLGDANCEIKEKHKKDVAEFLKKMEAVIEVGIADKSIFADLDAKLAIEYFLNNLYIIMHNYYNKHNEEKKYIAKSIKMMMRTFK